jgi:hypothetical protein
MGAQPSWRLVWSFVEGLDLTALLATIKAVDGRPGHPPADPRILLALWLYATVEGIGSARNGRHLRPIHRHPAPKHAAGTFQLLARSIKRSTKVDSFSGSHPPFRGCCRSILA